MYGIESWGGALQTTITKLQNNPRQDDKDNTW